MPLDQPVYEPESDDLDLPAAKRDLRGLAAKEDLKDFATKKEFAALAHTITDAVSRIMDERTAAVLSAVQKSEEKVLKRLETAEEERAIATERIKDRLDDHERFLVRQGKPAYRP
ncbi:MAG: hypothetical protein K8I02_06540 [Candidatus Methylomirabilis sp.]|nr:hypothetical protein [Deltaproteobacteria bacterium]